MREEAIRAVLVDDGQRGGALLKLLNGYARTVATSAETALAKLKSGGVDLVVLSCAAREASLLIPHIKGVPHLLIEWRIDGPCCVSTSCRDPKSGAVEPLPSVIAELVEQVRSALGRPAGSDPLCDAVVTVTEENRVEGVSPAAERMFQYPAHELLGNDAGMLLPLCLPTPDSGGQGFETVATRRDGTRFPILLTVEEMVWGGRRRYVVSLRDLTRRTDPLEVMARHAVRDELTGLFHHNTLPGFLDQALTRAERFATTMALLLLDVDHLAIINEMHGRETGDQVLVATARMVASSLRDVDWVVRSSGDEIAVILQESSEAKAAATADRIRRSIAHLPITVAGSADRHVPVRVTLSIGMALFPVHVAKAESVLSAAASALAEAKGRGGDCVVNYHAPAASLQPVPLHHSDSDGS
ncbi:sensor domain-containing diguanylate cyclase [Geomesophilobacter sediminis]|uniref:GGDEF domain-containing protein n=1 Tax=Geomesophilobacter sediminis TaxID=2798584 RepID=A0A8J7M2U2_9BACT|nr:sensor domain-containing diguanylate cyclase [Geomesophilobacter sediminis]MBJ6727602.1 GGDEF domain-containing protein [Geomesophilobacter sediminis]